jgi:Barstar (barnase inhibitor).
VSDDRVPDRLEPTGGQPDRSGPRPGLVRAGPPDTAGTITAEAVAAGVPVHLVGPVGSRSAFYASVASVLALPDWFGHNLDALADCLADLSWLPPGPRILVWAGSDRLGSADPDGYAALVRTLAEVAEQSADGPHPLTVVLVDG